MPFKFYLTSMWEWVANTGLSLAILICIAILIPRIGRLVVRWATIKMNEHEERRGEIADTEGYKGRLAILGALVYIAEAIAFFFVAIRILKDFGFSTTGAAVPATVVSAAVAFGAQKIIADFLAGFFIITERQYGVGDWVILQNKNAPVEGTVTAITLRSTTVRTLNGQEAVVPNSVPLVAVNASSGWAKAQIDIPVPLTAGDSTEDLNALFDGCVNRTLAKPEIARLVSDDPDAVSILPALDLIPPTSAGVPWSIKYRVLIRVEPGQQWTVERALRSAVMDEMWASYSRSTIDGLPGLTWPSGNSHHRHGDGRDDDALGHGAHASEASGKDTTTTSDDTQALDTTRRWATTLQREEDEFEGRPTTEDAQGAASSETANGGIGNVGPTASGNGSGTANDSETVVFPSASGSTSGSTAETRVFSPEDDTAAAERAAQASDHGVNPSDRGTSSADASDATTSKKAEDTRTSLEKEAEDAQQNGLFRRISYERRIQRLFSIGGRCRASTSAIVLVLIILVILQGLTYDGGDRGSGILAPSSFQSRSDTKESDDKSESSAPTTPESNTHSENPTTERDSNSENGSNTPTTTPNRTQPTTTAPNTDNNRNQQNSTNGNQNSGNNGNAGSNSNGDNSDNGGANQQDTDSSNQGSGSGNSNSGNDNSGQMNLSHGQGDNNTASTMAP